MNYPDIQGEKPNAKADDTHLNVSGGVIWERDFKFCSIAKQRVSFIDKSDNTGMLNNTAYSIILFNKYVITLARKP